MRKRCARCLFVVMVSLGLGGPALAQTPSDRNVATETGGASAARRAALTAFLRYAPQSLAKWGTPGMAVAVVLGDEPVLVEGFGNRRLGDLGKVDAHTRFALASLTKTFTAAAALQLATEGKLPLGVPIKTLRSDFVLRDAVASEQLTMLDVLSHRSGIADAADLLWSGTGYSRSEVLSRLAQVPQATPLRSGFSYSNVMYVLAGEQAAASAGTTWETLISRRILAPARLQDAGFGTPSAADGNAASPHALRDGKLTAIPARDLHNIGPAASIYASATDLSRWLRLWLYGGMLDGEQILAKSVVDAMWTPHTIVGLPPWAKRLYPESHFLLHGLGWMLQDYRSKLVAWNTGGIDGYSCSLAILPEEKLGVAVLTNTPFTGLPEAMVFWLIDAWLSGPQKDWSELRLKMSLESRARQARAVAVELGPQSSTTWPIPVEKMLGKYVSPLLGSAELTQQQGVVKLRIAKSLTAQILPWQPGRLRIQFDDPSIDAMPLTWTLSAKGQPAELVLGEYGAFVRAEAPATLLSPAKPR